MFCVRNELLPHQDNKKKLGQNTNYRTISVTFENSKTFSEFNLVWLYHEERRDLQTNQAQHGFFFQM